MRAVIITGTSAARSEAALALAEALAARAPDPASGSACAVYCTAGVHPHEATSLDESALDSLERLASAHRCVAVGECGLDFNRDLSPRDVQEAAFVQQADPGPETPRRLKPCLAACQACPASRPADCGSPSGSRWSWPSACASRCSCTAATPASAWPSCSRHWHRAWLLQVLCTVSLGLWTRRADPPRATHPMRSEAATSLTDPWARCAPCTPHLCRRRRSLPWACTSA